VNTSERSARTISATRRVLAHKDPISLEETRVVRSHSIELSAQIAATMEVNPDI
jgi:hypothetical protein